MPKNEIAKHEIPNQVMVQATRFMTMFYNAQ